MEWSGAGSVAEDKPRETPWGWGRTRKGTTAKGICLPNVIFYISFFFQVVSCNLKYAKETLQNNIKQ